MKVSTPLGPDKLLLTGFTGHEQISGLYSFTLDLITENTTVVDFGALLGKEFAVTMLIDAGTDGVSSKERYFRGVCRRIVQGDRDDNFTSFTAEIVPPLWLTTRIARSRVFQHLSVPDILKKVLSGLQVKWMVQGTFEKRDYCVQYRETDFNFCSRLMEEEGIFYFFKHNKDNLEMVVANTPSAHEEVEGAAKLSYDVVTGSHRRARNILEWSKAQEVRSGKYTLWDHCFELPGNNLEAKKSTLGSVQIGRVSHNLQVGGNENFEIYDYPGEYAQRFDGIDTGGGEQASELSKVHTDKARTASLRMEAETVAGVLINATSNCNQLSSGYKFTLIKHFNGDGKYLVTAVRHSARGGTAYRSGTGSDFVYSNEFTCIPDALPFRPQRTTPKPSVPGVQTAIVVGPQGQEIFTDKYGRVKVQFPWDREGQSDADSSCWLRVGTPWAGKQWGAIHIPRIGQEVIVQFLEGDPDNPIIVGSVYNAGSMPPYKLPDEKTKSTLKSNSSIGGGGFNEIRFEDKKDSEQIFIHAQKDRDITVKNDNRESIGNEEHLTVESNRRKHVKGQEHIIVEKERYTEVRKDEHLKITGSRSEAIGETHGMKAGSDIQMKAGQNVAVEGGMNIHIKAGMKLVIEAGVQLSLKVGGNFVDLGPSGLSINGTPTVLINSGGAAGSGDGCSPSAPEPPEKPTAAKNDSKAGSSNTAGPARNEEQTTVQSPNAVALQAAAATGAPFCPVPAA